MIKQLDSLTEVVKRYAADQHEHVPGTYEFDFHFYGKEDGNAEDASAQQSPEVFLIGEVLASSQELATSVASTGKIGITVSCNIPQSAPRLLP